VKFDEFRLAQPTQLRKALNNTTPLVVAGQWLSQV
jgi:hypothetical protein